MHDATQHDEQTHSDWPSWRAPFGLELPSLRSGECPYLADRDMWMRGFAHHDVPPSAYQQLLDAGFRRSGAVYYCACGIHILEKVA